MKHIKIEEIHTGIKAGGETEIEKIESNLNELKIIMNHSDDKEKIIISFKSPIGFRVLDEGDLLEFWPTCSSQNGWIFKIIEGGWKELESMRYGFLSKKRKFDEYLITGTDDCINVFSVSPPSIQKI